MNKISTENTNVRGRERAAEETSDSAALVAEVARLKEKLVEQTALALREREAERASIARELHDKFGQYLTIMALELRALGAHTEFTDAYFEKIKKLEDVTEQAHKEISQFAWEIRPGSLEGIGIERACEQLVAEWKDRSNLSFDLHLSLGKRDLPPLIQLTLYRILQEALTNVVKHAGAHRVGAILRATAQSAVLIIEDDGNGLAPDGNDLEEMPGAKLGLRVIRERLALIGGTIEIESAPGRGTTLLVSVPL